MSTNNQTNCRFKTKRDPTEDQNRRSVYEKSFKSIFVPC